MYAVEVLATIGFFSTLMVLGVIFLRNRHRERLALIQYGKDNTVYDKHGGKHRTLKFGLLLVAVGAGLLVGNLIDVVFGSEPIGKFASVFFLGGLALIYYHQITNGDGTFNYKRPFDNKDNEDDLL